MIALFFFVAFLVVVGAGLGFARERYRNLSAGAQQNALIEQQNAVELFSEILLFPKSESAAMAPIATQMAAMGIGPGDPTVKGLRPSQYNSIAARYASIFNQMRRVVDGYAPAFIERPTPQVTSLSVNVLQNNQPEASHVTETQIERLRATLVADITERVMARLDKKQSRIPDGNILPPDRFTMVMSKIVSLEKALGARGIPIPFDERWP